VSTYPGGKAGSGVYQQIINQIPPHVTYIEPFLGAGAIMRFKRPAIASIAIDIDPAVIKSFTPPIPNLKLINGDAISFLQGPNFPDARNTFIYLDPPYLMTARSSSRQIYAHEFGDAGQHEALLGIARLLHCRVAISGYQSDLYADLLHDWRVITFPAMTRGGTIATEWLWMNYDEPLELHDYRYLGKNYRERERIKRKKTRWAERLRNMPASERYAMLYMLDELRGSGSDGDGEGAGSIAG